MTLRDDHITVFVVLRVDRGFSVASDSAPVQREPGARFDQFEVTPKEVVATADEAIREVARLNQQAAERGVSSRYYWSGSRWFPDGGSFGDRGPEVRFDPAPGALGEAGRSLAERFGYPYGPHMQDWPWEVAEVARLRDYLRAYDETSSTDAERVELMEMMIQCVEDDLCETGAVHPLWPQIDARLVGRMDLHRATVEYWACGEARVEGAFRVAPLMRGILRRIGE